METQWKHIEDILVNGEPMGTLAVFYLEGRSFLREERDLVGAIAERLGKLTERIRVQMALEESETRFRDLVENLNSASQQKV